MSEIDKLLSIRRDLIACTDRASEALVLACKPHRGEMGLVSDEFRSSDLYKSLNSYYQTTKKALQTFNQGTRHNKEFQKAIREEIMQRRMSKVSK